MRTQNFLRQDAKRLLPNRKSTDNKTRGGKTLIVGGTQGLEGAAILAATSAARSGAGYVYLYSDSKQLLAIRHPDFLRLQSLKDLNLKMFAAAALGPGFRNKLSLSKWIQKFEKSRFQNVVLDAEALNWIAQSKRSKKFPATWIMTPHEGELARLLNVSSDTIRKNRVKSVLQAQKKYDCIILLKGHGTLVADQNRLVKISTGNPALAKAGTGDVLTGIITGLLSQKLAAIDAACLGAFIHGLMADRWIKKGHDVLSLMATDLIDMLPQTLMSLRK